MEQSLRTLPDLALFVEVARCGSFRHAAARLEMPVSTLSRRIAAFEARLGITLLQRTTRSVALSPAAGRYYERCLEVLDALERAQDELSAAARRRVRLRVAMPVDLGVEMLAPAVAGFADAHPGLQVEFELASRAVDLLREPVDLAFRIGRPLDDRVVARRIGTIASGLYAAPALLRRIAPIGSPAQLVQVPCLDLRTAQGSMAWKVGAAHWDAAPGPSVFAANSVALLCRFAQQGRGVALLPQHLAAEGVVARRLARVLPDEDTPAWPLYALTARRTAPEPVRLLIAHVRQALALAPVASAVGGAVTGHPPGRVRDARP